MNRELLSNDYLHYMKYTYKTLNFQNIPKAIKISLMPAKNLL